MHPVRVELGPLPSTNALVWLDYADAVVDRLERGEGPLDIAPDLLAAFRSYLADWRTAAEASPTFRWEGEASAEVVEYLLHAWFKLAQALEAEAAERPERVVPAEGVPFHQALVDTLIRTLRQEGRSPADFAEHLDQFWPGRRRR